MKKLLTLLACLCMVSSAGAAMSDNFNDQDISDWTVIQSESSGSYGAMTIYDQGSGDYCLYKPDYDASFWTAEKSVGGSYASGTVILEVTTQSNGAWRPLNFALVDASGNGAWLECYQADTYITMGARKTTDNGISGSGGSISDIATTPTNENVLKYEFDLGTGVVKSYIGGVLKHTATAIDMTGVGAITDVVINSKKRVYIDDISVVPEPATLALLAFGGLGALIRRRS